MQEEVVVTKGTTKRAIRLALAVLIVTHERMSDFRKVPTDLVMSATLDFDLDECHARKFFEHAILCRCRDFFFGLT